MIVDCLVSGLLDADYKNDLHFQKYAFPVAQLLAECHARSILRFARLCAQCIRGESVVEPRDFEAAQIALFGAASIGAASSCVDPLPMPVVRPRGGATEKASVKEGADKPATVAAAASANLAMDMEMRACHNLPTRTRTKKTEHSRSKKSA